MVSKRSQSEFLYCNTDEVVAFLLIIAKLSDLLGPKLVLILSNVVFLAFSIACGTAKTMTQL